MSPCPCDVSPPSLNPNSTITTIIAILWSFSVLFLLWTIFLTTKYYYGKYPANKLSCEPFKLSCISLAFKVS